MEGSALSGRDLAVVHAESAEATLVLADRFRGRSPAGVEAEDLGVLFRVWAIKAYTKEVPLMVQVGNYAYILDYYLLLRNNHYCFVLWVGRTAYSTYQWGSSRCRSWCGCALGHMLIVAYDAVLFMFCCVGWSHGTAWAIEAYTKEVPLMVQVRNDVRT